MRRHSVSRFLHLWLSVPSGIVIAIICLSGALLVFERDFSAVGQGRVESIGRPPLPLDSIIASAAKEIKDNKIVGVTIYPDSARAYKVMLARPAMAALWVDQYSGRVMGQYERPAVFRFASAAHRRLFAQSKSQGGNPAAARTVVGVTSILIVVIVVTGVILWWPSSDGQWKKKFAIPIHSGYYAFWHGLHCAGGAIVGIVLLICAFTGLTWSFDWYRDGVYTLLGSESAKPARRTTGVDDMAAWQTAYQSVASQHCDKEVRVYEGEIDVVRGVTGNRQAVDTYYFDSVTGAITEYEPYEAKLRSVHIKGWIYSLHVGSWGGWLTKIVYFMVMIVGASLPLTGYYLWIKRILRKKSNVINQKQD